MYFKEMKSAENKYGKDSETFEVIYVVDKKETLLGYILLKEIW